jgi:multiple sugar transport system ATP-binding protein
VLLDGRLQQLATPRQLYDRPANRFVAGFIGSPPMNLLDGTVVETDGNPGIEVEGQRLALVDDLPRVVPSPGDTVVLGLRPEDLTLVTADPGRRGQTLSATVVLVEELGAEEIVHLRLGDQPEAIGSTLVVRAAGASKLAPDDHAHVIVDPRRFHFFDADHGLTLDGPVPRVDARPDASSTHGVGQ